MNSVAEALNTLISAVHVAYNKGGVYTLEEAAHIHSAISYLNSLQAQAPAEAPQAPQAPAAEEVVQPPYQGDPQTEEGDTQGY